MSWDLHYQIEKKQEPVGPVEIGDMSLLETLLVKETPENFTIKLIAGIITSFQKCNKGKSELESAIQALRPS